MRMCGTTVKRDAVNRALREVAQRREEATTDLESWITDVAERLNGSDWDAAWRQ